jgi:TPR repeat protein
MQPTEPSPRPHLQLASLAVALLLLASCGSSEFKTLQAKAKKGDPQAQLELAKVFMYGKGAKQNEVEARKWIEKAASQGVPAAQRIFGTMLRDAYGADHRDIPKAREWLKKAADQGDAEAKVELAATPELPTASQPKR